MKEVRKESGIWLSPTDIAYAYKPLKMGLRIANLHEPWDDFVVSYDRVVNTCSQIFQVELSREEREADLDAFRRMRDTMKKNQMIHDTSFLLN